MLSHNTSNMQYARIGGDCVGICQLYSEWGYLADSDPVWLTIWSSVLASNLNSCDIVTRWAIYDLLEQFMHHGSK